MLLPSPIFLCHKIEDGGYKNTNINKPSPTQNTGALQAIVIVMSILLKTAF